VNVPAGINAMSFTASTCKAGGLNWALDTNEGVINNKTNNAKLILFIWSCMADSGK
jgi:hypothetical protein